MTTSQSNSPTPLTRAQLQALNKELEQIIQRQKEDNEREKQIRRILHGKPSSTSYISPEEQQLQNNIQHAENTHKRTDLPEKRNLRPRKRIAVERDEPAWYHQSNIAVTPTWGNSPRRSTSVESAHIHTSAEHRPNGRSRTKELAKCMFKDGEVTLDFAQECRILSLKVDSMALSLPNMHQYLQHNFPTENLDAQLSEEHTNLEYDASSHHDTDIQLPEPRSQHGFQSMSRTEHPAHRAESHGHSRVNPSGPTLQQLGSKGSGADYFANGVTLDDNDEEDRSTETYNKSNSIRSLISPPGTDYDEMYDYLAMDDWDDDDEQLQFLSNGRVKIDELSVSLTSNQQSATPSSNADRVRSFEIIEEKAYVHSYDSQQERTCSLADIEDDRPELLDTNASPRPDEPPSGPTSISPLKLSWSEEERQSNKSSELSSIRSSQIYSETEDSDESEDEESQQNALLAAAAWQKLGNSNTEVEVKKARTRKSVKKQRTLRTRTAKKDVAVYPDEYIVEKIVAQTRKGQTLWYYVKWAGYPDSENTWEPESCLVERDQICEALVTWRDQPWA